jgi:Putative prokaryotic signal transducing protein
MSDDPDDDPHAPTTIFESSDPALLAIAKTLLQDNKIYFFVAGEGLQELFVFGRYGTGFNPLVGPARIQVAKENAAHARELLRDLRQGP